MDEGSVNDVPLHVNMTVEQLYELCKSQGKDPSRTTVHKLFGSAWKHQVLLRFWHLFMEQFQ